MKTRRKKAAEFTLQKKEKKKQDNKFSIRKMLNTFLVVFAAIVLGYGVVEFCVQTVIMTGPSMQTVISDGDELVLNKIGYKVGKIKRFDVVAIKKIGSEDDYYDIKRVVGIPGDSLSVVAGRLVINGKQTSENYSFSFINSAGVLSDTIKLEDEEYFCIGDNTSNSEDSRFVNYGKVQKSEIKGKVIYRLFPKERRGKIK